MSVNKSSGISRLLAMMRPYRTKLVLGFLLSAGVVVSTLMLPVLSGAAVDAMLGAGAVNFTVVYQQLSAMCVALSATALCQWLMTDVFNAVVYGLMYDLRCAAFDKIQRLPLAYLDAHPSGDVVARVITDIEQISSGLLLASQQLFVGLLTIVLTLAFMFSLDVRTTIIVICVTPLSLVLASFMARKAYSYFQEQTQARGAMTSVVSEMLEGLSTVRLFAAEHEAEQRFEDADWHLGEASLMAVFISAVVNPATRFVTALVFAGVCASGALSAIAGGISVGGLTAFLAYANQYTKPFNDISGVVSELQNSIACAERVFDFLDEEEVEADSPQALELGDVAGSVAIRDLDFAYDPARPLIRELSLEAAPGQMVAIVGPTGCGKTTLINLLMRFYDPQAGSIEIDGRDIRTITRSSLRAGWGMVLQDAWIADATVHENIAMGKPEATREEVEAAAREAFADTFIQQLPSGYDTLLEGAGEALSAGQRQLLCIARVMLAVPPMLILDEATSNIDTRTEQRIQAAVNKLMEGRTSFVVAHRLSTIRNADKILVMRDGSIVETGTHEELLAAGGFYAHLYHAQFEPA